MTTTEILGFIIVEKNIPRFFLFQNRLSAKSSKIAKRKKKSGRGGVTGPVWQKCVVGGRVRRKDCHHGRALGKSDVVSHEAAHERRR